MLQLRRLAPRMQLEAWSPQSRSRDPHLCLGAMLRRPRPPLARPLQWAAAVWTERSAMPPGAAGVHVARTEPQSVLPNRWSRRLPPTQPVLRP